MNIAELYNQQVHPYKTETTRVNKHGKTVPVNRWSFTRAEKDVRYKHFKEHKDVDIFTKERWAIDLIKMALGRAKKPVISCSFGIDSIMVLYLTRKALVEMGRDPSDIEIVWNNTLNEFPEVREFATTLTEAWDLNLTVTKPKKPLKKIIDDNGGIDSSYFTARKGSRKEGQPLSERCCNTLKHEPMKRATKENNWDLIMVGLRADESNQRKLASLRDGEYFYSSGTWNGTMMARPILWMTDDDIWEYVKHYDVPHVGLYNNNLIQKYPEDMTKLIMFKDRIIELGIDYDKLMDQQVQTLDRHQQNFLSKKGFKIFNPRVGCQMCPIPVKYGYLQWMRTYYPRVYQAMVHNLGYGKALLGMIPEDVKEEIKVFTGVDIDAENAHEHLKEILEAKPCVFDIF
ncbi:phosphoadenosine phosphosulfate reductase family protein [Exiguobacterium sp. s78]|uniref:phosphoadenosine phosphosulfate reductase family protein n=1 Tax=Exiguobacterium sp. s78 TaxID=2751197 RepID=UPI001BECBB59|nr:phosphoadenosine phosphosulfate reductase family protein [Exiguobacterium sp. s78]